MKKLFLFLLLAPLGMLAQENAGYPVFTNIILTANPAEISQFESAVKEHNARFHAEGDQGARVYQIMNGTNADKYVWTMGPHTWATIDEMDMGGDHFNHWNNEVLAHTIGNATTHVWRFRPERSNFSKDFDLKYLNVFIVDVARFGGEKFMSVVDRVNKVYAEKWPDYQYGTYYNTMPSNDGMDFAWVDFFDKMAWLGQDDEFAKNFEEVHGAGSFATFMEDVAASTDGEMTEVWMYREDLSGLGPQVMAVQRQ